MPRKLLPLLLLALSAPAWGAYAYKATITVPHAQVSGLDSANMSDFTVGVKLSDTSFKAGGSGGQILHTVTVNGQSIPTDLIFTIDSTCAAQTGVTGWEVQSYDSTGGVVYAWVRVPTLSYTADTVFYVCYGGSQATFIGGTAWNSNFVHVVHPASATVPYDSVGGALLTQSGVSNTTTAYGSGAIGVTATSNYVQIGDLMGGTNPSSVTMEGMTSVTADSVSGNGNILVDFGCAACAGILIDRDPSASSSRRRSPGDASGRESEGVPSGSGELC